MCTIHLYTVSYLRKKSLLTRVCLARCSTNNEKDSLENTAKYRNMELLTVFVPEGSRRDDQMSCEAQSADSGGQLMTGKDVLPETVGPRPLLRPATATNIVGRPSPAQCIHTLCLKKKFPPFNSL